jgi:SHS2 domain-containing protein
MEFEFLDHPADIGFRARGSTLEQLFENCAHALIAIILDPSQIHGGEQTILTAEGSDRESLLVNWLNEVLYYVDTKRFAFESFNVEFPSPEQIRAVARFEARDPLRHPVRLSVKAVTYHQLRVSSVENEWIAEVYVDV